MTRASNSQRTVALLIESSRAYGRGLLHGISRYVRAHGNWLVLHQERMLEGGVPRWLSQQHFDGIIARIETTELLEAIREKKVPTVDLLGRFTVDRIPQVRQSHVAIAEMAGEHLRQRGFQHFAYCGFAGAGYSIQRRDAFVQWANRAGFEPHVYEDSPANSADTSDMEATGMLDSGGLKQWICRLPRPLALMACNDARGQQVLTACRACGIRVPDEMAVVGVDNDEVVCDLADPPLSSVLPPTNQIGYASAMLLERMMAGEAPPEEPIMFDPSDVITRLSTDTLAVEDKRVATAIRIIRDEACNGLNVDELLELLDKESLQISRSTLERRFSEVLGRSPKDEILRVRLARVKQLLIDTDHPLTTIAQLVGIEHHEYLSAMFKSKVGETPGSFRERMGSTRVGRAISVPVGRAS